MIAIDEQHTQRELDRFGQAVQRYSHDLGLSVEKTLEWRVGRLTRKLIDITPPTEPAKTKKAIEDSVTAKFQTGGSGEQWDAALSESGGKHGSGSVYWYAWNSQALYGVDKDADLRDSSPEAIAYLAARLTAKGKLRAGKHGRQTVYISRKFLTKPKTVKAAIKIIQGHVGRLKAGWMVAWRALGSPGAQVPQWISKHEQGAKGYIVNSSAAPGMPSITIANFAKGAGSMKRKFGWLIQKAIKSEIGGMMADLKFAIKNPTKWRERQSAAGLETGTV